MAFFDLKSLGACMEGFGRQRIGNWNPERVKGIFPKASNAKGAEAWIGFEIKSPRETGSFATAQISGKKTGRPPRLGPGIKGKRKHPGSDGRGEQGEHPFFFLAKSRLCGFNIKEIKCHEQD